MLKKKKIFKFLEDKYEDGHLWTNYKCEQITVGVWLSEWHRSNLIKKKNFVYIRDLYT